MGFNIQSIGEFMISIALIHPLLVHFPIVLLIAAVAMDIMTALLMGTVSAGIAAIFGDIALDKAISLGFPSGPLETHEMFALITLGVFIVHSLLRLFAVWRRYPLRGFSGWISALPGMVGLVLLIATAYYGGELVYHFGVNVASVTP